MFEIQVSVGNSTLTTNELSEEYMSSTSPCFYVLSQDVISNSFMWLFT